MKDEQTAGGLDQEKFLKMFSAGDVIHWKEAIWTDRPQYGRPRLAGEQEATGRIVSLTDKTASIEVLAAEITDVRLPGSAQNELVPYEPGSVVRKRISTLLKGNVVKTVAPKPKKKESPALKVVVDNDPPGAKVGRNDPCPCGSNKKYKKCCMGKNMEVEMKASHKQLQEAIGFSGYTVEDLLPLWPEYYHTTLAHFTKDPKWKDGPVHLDLIIVGFARYYASWVIIADDELSPTTKRRADAFWAVMKEVVIASGTSDMTSINQAFWLIKDGDYKRLDKAREDK